MEAPRDSSLKLEVPNPNHPETTEPIFIKATWFGTHFHLSITDGLDAWVCRASEEEVRERAAQWDQPVSEYIELAERYLGFQQPESIYKFTYAGDGNRRLSWTFEKEGTKLEWRWKCEPSPDCKKTTSGILDFLLDSNIRLSEEVVSKTKSFEGLKVEAEKCLAQSERFNTEKMEFESAIYAKFLGVLNTKKSKLRELRDELAKQGNHGKLAQENEESTEKMENFDEEISENSGGKEDMANAVTSKDARRSKARRTKRVTLG